MIVKVDYPPNFKEIEAKFHPPHTVCFTYGDVLYNPWDGYIAEDLFAHEETHARQQGNDPEGWWKKYIEDVEFRMKQEAEAYHAQFKKYKDKYRDGNKRAIFLHKLACDFSGPIYGKCIDYPTAVWSIKTGV